MLVRPRSSIGGWDSFSEEQKSLLMPWVEETSHDQFMIDSKDLTIPTQRAMPAEIDEGEASQSVSVVAGLAARVLQNMDWWMGSEADD